MFRHKVDEDNDQCEAEESDVDESDVENKSDNLKPSLDKVKQTIEKVSALLEKVCPILECNNCEFEAKDKNGLNVHIKAKHNNKS